MSLDAFESEQSERLSRSEFFSTLVVQIVDILHKYDQGETRPLILKCCGASSERRMAIAAFNVYRGRHHNTAFELLNRLADISGNNIIGSSFVFVNLSLHGNNFALSDGVDEDLVIAHYEEMTKSRVYLRAPDSIYSDLSLWKASELVDIRRASVSSVCYRTESYNHCRLVLKLVIGGREFLAISYLWSQEYVRELKNRLEYLMGRTISITNATLLRYPLYDSDHFTLGLRQNAIIQIAGSEHHASSRVNFIEFDCPHYDQF